MVFRKHIISFITFLAFVCPSCTKVPVNIASNTSSSGIIMYGNQYGNKLQSFGRTVDGGYFLSGYTLASNGLNQQGFIQKTDKNGKILWYHEYGGKYLDEFLSVHQTSDGGFIAVGSTSSIPLNIPQPNYNTHAYILKTDANGQVLWQKVFGGPFNDQFYDVAETPDHSFVATGFFEGVSGTLIQKWLYIVKVDQNGDSLWTHTTSSYTLSTGTSVAICSDGIIGVTGYAKKTDTSYIHPLFASFATSGQVINPVITFDTIVMHDDLLNNSAERIKNEKLISMQDGFIFICGSSPLPSPSRLDKTGDNYFEVTIIAAKIDQKGNFGWNHAFIGHGNGVDLCDAVMNNDGSLLISVNLPDAAWLLNLNSAGTNTSEIFIPGVGFAEGCTPVDNFYALGINLIPANSSHAYYFGMAITDQNGKIK